MQKQNLPIANGIVLFKGKHGATRQYAKWIGLETGYPVFDVAKADENLTFYDLVILGSAVYAGKYYLLDWLKKNWPVLRDKHLILFTVSGTAPDHPDIKKYFEANLSPEMQECLEYFPLQGKLRLDEVNWFMRFFLKLAAKVEKDEDARLRLKYGFDYVEKENIAPVVEAARELAMIYRPVMLGK